jgi:hypothetical protein
MVMNHAENALPSVGISDAVLFAGDDVRLAGQMDYPQGGAPAAGYPLIFIIQHATSNSRKEFEPITKLGTEMNAAVFRWDKRGTGASGSGSSGSVTVDTLKAYETAIAQPQINPAQVIIYAQNEGTMLLGEAYKRFRQIRKPRGIVLAGNMLDEKSVLVLDVPLHIIVSKNDWNAWQTYAEAAADAHAEKYKMPPSFYVATNTNRRLMYTNGGTFHRGAELSIKHWLQQTCQIS